MGNILILAYHYPPLANVSSIRNAKLVKYLSRLNWNIDVVTGIIQSTEEEDQSLLSDIPDGIALTRIDSYSRYIRKIETKSAFPDLWWWLPDRQFLWINNSIRECSRIIKKKHIDIILSSSPPYSSAIIGLWLAKLHGTPLVIDFRDPWTQNFYLAPYPTGFHNWLNETLENLVAKSSISLIFNSNTLREFFLEKFTNIPADRCFVLPNGYDHEDFSKLHYSPPKKFTISSIGTSYDSGPFLKNLSYLVNNGNIPKDSVNLQMTPQSSETMQFIEKFGLMDIASLTGRVLYRKSIELMKNSHALLLTLPKGEKYIEGVPSAKIYMYMATGNPVLAIVPSGEAMRITQEYVNGIAVDPSDDESIRRALLDLYGKYKKGEIRPIPQNEIPDEYRHDKLAAKLSDILKGASRA